MKSEDIVQKVVEAVDAQQEKLRLAILQDCIRTVSAEKLRFNETQLGELRAQAARVMGMTQSDYVATICHIMLDGSDIEPSTKMESFPQVFSDERADRGMDLVADIMRDVGIIDANETPLYADPCSVEYVTGDSLRMGAAFFTDKRIIVQGHYVAIDVGSSTTHRLYYDDWESMPYLISIDYIYYDRISSLESVWKFRAKNNKIVYNTKYVEDKSRSLGGPYFFKFNLGTTHTLKEGDINIKFISSSILGKRRERHDKTAEMIRTLANL